MKTLGRSLTVAALVGASAFGLDLKNAVIVANPREKKVAAMLTEEIEKRTRIRLAVSERPPASGRVDRAERAAVDSSGQGRGRVSRCRSMNGTVQLAGNDAAGRCSRRGRCCGICRWSGTSWQIADEFKIATAPKYPLRGHQLGYRPKTNSYDALGRRAVGAVHPRPGGLRHATPSS